MKYVIFTPILFCIFTDLFSQSSDDLVGTWKVIEATLNGTFEYDQATESDLKLITAALEGSFIVISKSGKAGFSTRIPQFFIENARWKFDEDTGDLQFFDRKNKNILMKFIVAGRGDQLMFQMSESPFVLSTGKMK